MKSEDAVVKAAVAEQKAYKKWLDDGPTNNVRLHKAWMDAKKVYTDAVWALIRSMEKPSKKVAKKARS